MNRKDELRGKLREWRDSYYNLDPMVPDAVYDAAKDELARMDPEDEEVVAVGAPPPQFSVWEKVRHEIPMGSLGKVNSEAEFREWAGKLTNDAMHASPKIDGSSMELVYVDGKLIRCVTRGDGTIGEDVTANVSRIPDVPKKLPEPKTVTIRGEVVMTKAVFAAKYAEEYANPRNTAAGKVRDKKGGGAACSDLTFIAYWMTREDGYPRSMFAMFFDLKGLGFSVPPCGLGRTDQMSIYFFEEMKKRREELPYEMDGVVVSVNDLDQLEGMGDVNMRPRGQVAWKFEALSAETRVSDVKWQVGPTGRVTPVAVVEPVNIGGVVITSISLHNVKLFEDLRLSRGCRVLVSRRNDVIPYIERNLDLAEAA